MVGWLAGWPAGDAKDLHGGQGAEGAGSVSPAHFSLFLL